MVPERHCSYIFQGIQHACEIELPKNVATMLGQSQDLNNYNVLYSLNVMTVYVPRAHARVHVRVHMRVSFNNMVGCLRNGSSKC